MSINKQEILENSCYTTLVYERINKKLNSNFSKKEIEVFLMQVLKEDASVFAKKSKNYYITNTEHNIRITINSNTFRIITVDRIGK